MSNVSDQLTAYDVQCTKCDSREDVESRLIYPVLDHTNEQLPSHIDGLVPERRKSIANALELRLSCTNPSACHSLTHWGRNKMAAIYVAGHIFKCNFFFENDYNLINISLKFVLKGPIDNDW